jgi:hypothetical protein
LSCDVEPPDESSSDDVLPDDDSSPQMHSYEHADGCELPSVYVLRDADDCALPDDGIHDVYELRADADCEQHDASLPDACDDVPGLSVLHEQHDACA